MITRPIKALLITGAIAVSALVGFGVVSMKRTAEHRRQYLRMDTILRRSVESPPAGVAAAVWREIMINGPDYGLANWFLRPSVCPTEKMRTMADQFEARWPDGAKSFDDVEQMMQLMEASNPLAVGYSGFQFTRRLIKAGAAERAAQESGSGRK